MSVANDAADQRKEWSEVKMRISGGLYHEASQVSEALVLKLACTIGPQLMRRGFNAKNRVA